MKAIFFVITPYQLLLSKAIAKSEGYKNTHLVIINKNNFDFKNIDIGYFNKVSIIGNEDKVEVIRKIINNFRLISFVLYSLFVRKKYDNLFYANEKIPYIQGIIRIFRKGKTTINYVEDGANAYCDLSFSSNYNKFTIVERIIGFNRKYENIRCHGDFTITKNVYSLYPEYLRYELRNKNIIEIKKESLKEVLPTNSINNKVLILMEMSDSPNSKLFLNLIRRLNENNIGIMIKYHPREVNKYIKLKEFNKPNLIEELNSKISIEEILNGTEGNIVIANYSTSLHTLPLISDNIFISLYELQENKFQIREINSYINMLKKIGVLFPESISEVVNQIRIVNGGQNEEDI